MVDFVRRARMLRDAAVVGGAAPRYAARLVAFCRSLNIWFWAIVGLPTLLAGVYFFAIASDLYVSEVKFVVRGPAQSSPVSGLGALLQSATGTTGGSEDTFAVHEYLVSRDAVRRLERQDDLRAILTRPEGDFLSRFPGVLFWRQDFEALYDTYLRFVSVEIDSATGVSTLQVKAYRPEDAKRIAQALLALSEQLINELNDRARRDALKTFRQEVDSTEARIAKIQDQLTAYRIKEKMLDPKSAAAGPLALLAQMNAQLADSQAKLVEIIKNSPHSPQIRLVRTRIASLERLIAQERTKITGHSNSVAAALTEYERLDVQRKLAEQQLASAFTSLASARLQAQRQQLFLDTITQPNLADYPLYPKRFLSFATVVVTCLLAYGIVWLLVASVREHAAA